MQSRHSTKITIILSRVIVQESYHPEIYSFRLQSSVFSPSPENVANCQVHLFHTLVSQFANSSPCWSSPFWVVSDILVSMKYLAIMSCAMGRGSLTGLDPFLVNEPSNWSKYDREKQCDQANNGGVWPVLQRIHGSHGSIPGALADMLAAQLPQV